MITILTPTRNRAKALAYLEDYIARQTYKGELQWIIICDGGAEAYEFNMNQTVIHRNPAEDTEHSICHNYLAALNYVQGEKILCMEDDDWYREDYIETMDQLLNEADLVGFAPAYYYHVTSRRWRDMGNDAHSSLCSTGFTTKVLGAFATSCKQGTPYIDLCLWSYWPDVLNGSKMLAPIDKQKPIMVGIKGLPFGVRGIGLGHDPVCGCRDGNWVKLRKWVGKDWERYRY